PVLRSPPAGTRRAVLSFPTRRSSDLCQGDGDGDVAAAGTEVEYLLFGISGNQLQGPLHERLGVRPRNQHVAGDAKGKRPELPLRSEEHTSELQSRENLVCRLLLEKKN